MFFWKGLSGESTLSSTVWDLFSVCINTHTHVCFCRDEQCPCRWLIGETKPKYGSKARNKPTTALIQNQRVFALYANRVNELLQQLYFCRHRNIFNDRFLTESEILVCVCYTCLKFSFLQNGSQTYKDTHWSQWSHSRTNTHKYTRFSAVERWMDYSFANDQIKRRGQGGEETWGRIGLWIKKFLDDDEDTTMWHKHMHFLGRSHNPRGKQWLVCDEVKEENTNIYSWDQGGVDNNRTGVLLLILVVWLVQQSPMQIKEMEAFTFKVEILPFAVWFSVVTYRTGLVVLNWEPQAGMSKPCCLVCVHRSISPAIHQWLG